MRALLAAIRRLAARTRFERDLREELQLHLEHRADDLVASGMRRKDAMRRARIEFGTLESYKEQCRDAGGFILVRPFHGLGADLKLTARRLAATPLFTIFAILSLAMGVGVATAVYSVVDKVFWTELGVPDPEALVLVLSESGPSDARWVLSRPDLDDLRRAQTSFSSLAATQIVYPAVDTAAATEIHQGEAVDGAYCSVLHVTPSLGRAIQASDDSPSAAAVVMLSHWLWRTRFASDPAVVGRTVRIGGRPLEVIGVAPESFRGPIPGPGGSRLWVAAAAADWIAPRRSSLPERDRRRLTAIGRLRPGVTIEQATTELRGLGASLDAVFPPPGRVAATGQPAARGWRVRSIGDLNRRGDMFRRFGLLVMGLVALVLVVACTNLANLVLARATMRQQEFAVRRALGASRWRLIREHVTESAVLAAAGGIASFLVLVALIRLLDVEIPMAANLTVSVQPEINTTALGVAAAAVLLSLFVFGIEPALLLTRRQDVRAELAVTAGAVGAPTVTRQRRLLRWQVAISTGFFIIASLCVRYLVADARHDSGVDLDRIAVAMVNFSLQGWDETRARRTLQRVVEAARAEPGVDAVAVSSGLPFGTPITPGVQLSLPDATVATRAAPDSATLVVASADFFRASGISILRGRPFDDRDDAAGDRVAVLSEATARKMFGTADAVGRRLLLKPDRRLLGPAASEQPMKPVTVVGIAHDTDVTHFFLQRGNLVYVPFAQEYSPLITVVARGGDPLAAVGALRSAVRHADPDLAVERADTGRAMLAGPYVFLRGAGYAALSLGAVTLLLAMAGLYGVQSHLVQHRTREIGVRMSFGASARNIKVMVLKDGYGPVLQGLAIGLFIGLVGRAIVRSLVTTRIDVIDPWMAAVVPIPLLLAAFCASYLPARRASRVDPNVALRHL